jgi:hypothetical protein
MWFEEELYLRLKDFFVATTVAALHRVDWLGFDRSYADNPPLNWSAVLAGEANMRVVAESHAQNALTSDICAAQIALSFDLTGIAHET